MNDDVRSPADLSFEELLLLLAQDIETHRPTFDPETFPLAMRIPR